MLPVTFQQQDITTLRPVPNMRFPSVLVPYVVKQHTRERRFILDNTTIQLSKLWATTQSGGLPERHKAHHSWSLIATKQQHKTNLAQKQLSNGTIPEVFVFITFAKHNLRSARLQLTSLIFTEDLKVAREIHLQVRFIDVVISAENGKYGLTNCIIKHIH